MISETYQRPLRFLLSGGLAAVAEYSSFLLLHKSGLFLPLANALSFASGFVISFLLNKHWVFSHKGNVQRQLAQYFILAVTNLLVSSSVIVLLVHGIKMPAFIAKLCVMAMVASWNYVIFSKIIFRQATPND